MLSDILRIDIEVVESDHRFKDSGRDRASFSILFTYALTNRFHRHAAFFVSACKPWLDVRPIFVDLDFIVLRSFIKAL